MATAKPASKSIPERTLLMVEKENFHDQLAERIQLGEALLAIRLNTPKELTEARESYSIWNGYNSELLKNAFNNPNNEHKKSYDSVNSYSMVSIYESVDPVEEFQRNISKKILCIKQLLAKIPVMQSGLPEKMATARISQQKQENKAVFIGHGRSKLWARVQIFLESELGIKTFCFESESRTGENIVNILKDFLDNSSFAVLIMTAEDETASGEVRARQNVIHEAGLFQGKLGFDKVVILKQNNTEDFSNIAGLQYIAFSGENIEQCFYELNRTLKKHSLVN